MGPYRDPNVASRARHAQHAEEVVPTVGDDSDEELSFEVDPGEPLDDDPISPARRRWLLVVGVALVPICLLAIAGLADSERPPAAAAPPRLHGTFAVQVVSKSGELNVSIGDRCIVDLDVARRGECRLDVVCPGLEKHSSAPSCPMPGADSVIEAHWDGVDFDGQLLTFEVDGTERGEREKHGAVTARLDAWRHGEGSR